MKQTIVILALALSLLFNVFFAIGYWRARELAAPQRDVAQLAADELGLDETQAAVFAELRSDMDAERDVLQEGISLTRRELLKELGASSPDLDRVNELIEQEADYHRQLRAAAAERMRQFIELLSPEQREEVLQRISHAHPGHPRLKERIIRRFDVDGDGELDDDERAQAQSHLDERRRHWQRKRQDMIDRFDTNDDGQLDANERARLRDWIRSQRRDRGGSRRPPHGEGSADDRNP
jgi:Spy/CpxP family protein refolding chaperone